VLTLAVNVVRFGDARSYEEWEQKEGGRTEAAIHGLNWEGVSEPLAIRKNRRAARRKGRDR